MTPWLEALRTRPASAGAAVLVTVVSARGSAPREPGAKMLVDAEGVTGSIGGGALEHECTRLAAGALGHEGPDAFTRTFPLGANLGQCCGGIVDVLFERASAETPWIRDLVACHDQRRPAVLATVLQAGGLRAKHVITMDGHRLHGDPVRTQEIVSTARGLLARPGPARLVELEQGDGARRSVLLEPVDVPSMQVALFGAGHVASAVVAVMAGLDCEVRWVDSRRRVFPAHVPANVTAIEARDPVREVAAMPAGSYYLVMTHSHPLDYEICAAVLERGDFGYAGLIGSASKRKRFENLMRKRGMPPSLVARLTCPIGIPGIGGKRPAEIAISVAAELLRIRAARSGTGTVTPDDKNVHLLRRP
jgi:xanthine dehydrogenase accessory factor